MGLTCLLSVCAFASGTVPDRLACGCYRDIWYLCQTSVVKKFVLDF